MAYVIRRDEPVGEEITRILAEQNRRALGLLRHWEDNPRDNVHQARQALKRIRAVLRLVRTGAPYVYRVENALYRDVARDLAYARDTEAVIEALGLLADRVSGPLARESLRMLRVGLEQRAARERDCGIHDIAGRIAGACGRLEAAERRFRDLPLGGLRRKDLRRGLEATLERCADGFARAQASGLAEDLHAWRKDVKYASHQARLVQQMRVRRAATLGPALAGRIAGACGRLEAAERRFRDLPLGGLRRKDLRRGLDATLERCADGYARARASGLAEDLHAWRKDVKYASHQARLVQQMRVRRAATLGPALAGLATLLGHHQDLAILDALLRSQPDDLNVDVHLRSIRRALREEQAGLATRALAVGARTFGRPARARLTEPAPTRA